MWIVENWLRRAHHVVTTLGLAICLVCVMGSAWGPAASAVELVLDGDSYGESWVAAAPAEKLEYCRYAFSAFRSAPSTSYVISSNVQDISPEGFCTRLDQFYGFEVNLDTPLSEAAAIAPLLFADVSMDFQVERTPYQGRGFSLVMSRLVETRSNDLQIGTRAFEATASTLIAGSGFRLDVSVCSLSESGSKSGAHSIRPD